MRRPHTRAHRPELASRLFLWTGFSDHSRAAHRLQDGRAGPLMDFTAELSRRTRDPVGPTGESVALWPSQKVH